MSEPQHARDIDELRRQVARWQREQERNGPEGMRDLTNPWLA